MVQLYVVNLKWALGQFIMELKLNEVLILGDLILVLIRKMFVLAKFRHNNGVTRVGKVRHLPET